MLQDQQLNELAVIEGVLIGPDAARIKHTCDKWVLIKILMRNMFLYNKCCIKQTRRWCVIIIWVTNTQR